MSSTVYPAEPDSTRGDTGDYRRGVSNSRPIDAAKEAVGVLDLAERLCGDLKPVGGRYEACCPLPDHDDKTPSFNVYPDTNSWYCFGACQRGGDVVDLYAAVNGHEHLGEAAGFLLLEFGHEVPQRPASWYRRQSRQQKVREEWKQAQVRRAQRLIWRYICRSAALAMSDPELREKEGQRIWEEAERLAYLLVTAREGERI